METDLSCSSFERRVFHFQAGELPENERQAFIAHAGTCRGCARRLEVEDSMLGALKTRLARGSAPPGLETRVREALRAETVPRRSAGWLRSPWLVPVASSFLLAAVLLVGLGGGVIPPPADVQRVAQQVTVVDLACDRAGRTLAQQRRCTKPEHLNALKLSSGGYWNVSLDQESSREMITAVDMRGHILRVEGELYTKIQTVRLTEVEDLGLSRLVARAAGRRYPPGL